MCNEFRKYLLAKLITQHWNGWNPLFCFTEVVLHDIIIQFAVCSWYFVQSQDFQHAQQQTQAGGEMAHWWAKAEKFIKSGTQSTPSYNDTAKLHLHNRDWCSLDSSTAGEHKNWEQHAFKKWLHDKKKKRKKVVWRTFSLLKTPKNMDFDGTFWQTQREPTSRTLVP